MLVEHAPEFIAKYIPNILQKIVAIIQSPDAREDDNIVATDNAVSSLGKILEKFPAACDTAKLW